MEINSIKGQITKHIKKSMDSDNPRLNYWYCGITNDELRRKAEHNLKKGIVNYWKCFDAETRFNANEVESYFSKKGTINAPHAGGAKQNSRFVYIFKLNNSYLRENKGLGGVILTPKDIINLLFS